MTDSLGDGESAALGLARELARLDPRSPAYGDLVDRLAATGAAPLRAVSEACEQASGRWMGAAVPGVREIVGQLERVRSLLASVDPGRSGWGRLLHRGTDPDQRARRLIAGREERDAALAELMRATDTLGLAVVRAQGDESVIAQALQQVQDRIEVLTEADELLASAPQARHAAQVRCQELATQAAVAVQAMAAVRTIRANASELLAATARARSALAGLDEAAHAAGGLLALRAALDAVNGAITTGRGGAGHGALDSSNL